MIQRGFYAVIVLAVYLLAIPKGKSQVQVEKTNNMKVYMHYMPWFETPETIGRWGWHWTMNNRNPENINDLGQREIAAHFYPLIGPYASRDNDVIEYHLLLMKLAGVDGILIDWYGVQGSNGDVDDLLTSSNAIVEKTDDVGLQFAVTLEDRFSRDADDVKANLTYLKDNYFTKPNYILAGTNNQPLLTIFGPVTFQSAANWADMLPSAGSGVEFLTLWYESGEAGAQADGEFSWVYQDNSSHINHLNNFYTNRAASLTTAMGSIYPGFVDYYKEGGAGEGYFTIEHSNGTTLDATIAKAVQYSNKVDMMQLVTFNDFGEGTMFEPTVETGFTYLNKIQKYTGVPYGESELRLVHRLYVLRKQYQNNSEINLSLDTASNHLCNLRVNEAYKIIDDLDGLAVQGVEPIDNSFILYPNPIGHSQLQVGLRLNSSGDARMIIYNALGQPVINVPVVDGMNTLSLHGSNLAKGIYFVSLYVNNQRIKGETLVVE